MTTLTGWLTLINLLILIGGSIGGFFAVRSAITKANTDTQTRIREALHDENELLQSRVARLEKENRQLNNLMQLLMTMLKQTHQIEVRLDGDIVTLHSPGGSSSSRIAP